MRRRALTLVLCLLLAGAPSVTAHAAVPTAGTAARAGPAPHRPTQEPVAPTGDYGWPLPGWPRVGRAFDPPNSDYGRGHRGVDLVAVAGSVVLAAGDGTVAFAGELAGRGVVSIQHDDGLRTTYEPVTTTVAVGTHVTRGQVIGTLQAGHPGCPAAACLHWGVRRGADTYLDPLRLLGRWEVRLLPWQQ